MSGSETVSPSAPAMNPNLTGVPPHKKGRTAILLDWVARGTDYFLEGEEKPLPGRSTEYRERRLISNTCLVQMAHI